MRITPIPHLLEICSCGRNFELKQPGKSSFQVSFHSLLPLSYPTIHLVAPRLSSARWLFSLKCGDLSSLSACGAPHENLNPEFRLTLMLNVLGTTPAAGIGPLATVVEKSQTTLCTNR